MQASRTFQLFRDLWLEDPEEYLSTDDLLHLQQFLPCIRDLETKSGQKTLVTQGNWQLR